MKKAVMMVLVALCVVLVAPAGASDPVALNACKQAVEAKLRKKDDKVERVRFDDGKTKVKQESKKETSVKGRGEFDKKGKTREFNFRCTYNVKKNKVSDLNVENR